ncbi:MAG: flavin reductase family protein [Acidimicrobiia bacterium]
MVNAPADQPVLALEVLPDELRSRILAATGHADVRMVRPGAGGGFVVDALTGDRIVHMELGLRADGSVDEATTTFLRSAVADVRIEGRTAQVEVNERGESRSVAVPAELGAALAPVAAASTLEVPGPGPGPAAAPPPVPDAAFVDLVASLDMPMFIVTACDGDRRAGCLVGFVIQCSIHPPRLMVCLSKENYTWEVARDTDQLVVHFLAAGNAELADLFGAETGDDVDKFARCGWTPGPGGVPVLSGTNGWVAARVLQRTDAGDHMALLVEPTGTEAAPHRRAPLRWSQVQDLDPGHPA